MDDCQIILKKGDYGEKVDKLIYMLDRFAFHYPALPHIIPYEKYYSLSIETAVKIFQKIFYIEETGHIDINTWNIMNNIYDEEIKFYNSLKEALKFKTIPDYGVTQEVLEFLKYFYSDKIYDNKVIKKLIDYAIKNIPAGYFKYTARHFNGKIFSQGDTGNEVAIIQSYLRTLTLNQKEIFFYEINGIYDQKTKDSVEKFQQIYGLQTNGKCDMFTYNALADLYNFFTEKYCIDLQNML